MGESLGTMDSFCALIPRGVFIVIVFMNRKIGNYITKMGIFDFYIKILYHVFGR
jgi:hypothetical protein